MPTTAEHLHARELAAATAQLLAMDSELDATAAIQDALDQGVGLVVLPPGTYRVDAMLVIPAETTLALDGVTLVRRAAAVSTDPIVHLKGTRSATRNGTFVTEKAHPEGIILVGHRTLGSLWNVDNCVVDHPVIRGLQAAGNLAIKAMSSQPALGPTYSSYFHTFDSPDIRGCDIGILFTEKSNGNTIKDPQLWDCVTAGVCFQGAYGNTLLGGFLHTSANGVIGVKLENHGAQAFSTHHAQANTVVGYNVEPGGAASKGVVIADQCEDNYIEIMGNVAGGNTILNGNNTVFSRFGKFQFPTERPIELTALTRLGTETGLAHVENQGVGTCGENLAVALVDVAIGTRKAVLADVEIVLTNANLDRPTVVRQQYAVNNLGGEFSIARLDQGLGIDGQGLAVSWSNPQAGVARLAFTTFNNGTGSTYAYSWRASIRGSTPPAVTWL